MTKKAPISEPELLINIEYEQTLNDDEILFNLYSFILNEALKECPQPSKEKNEDRT